MNSTKTNAAAEKNIAIKKLAKRLESSRKTVFMGSTKPMTAAEKNKALKKLAERQKSVCKNVGWKRPAVVVTEIVKSKFITW